MVKIICKVWYENTVLVEIWNLLCPIKKFAGQMGNLRQEVYNMQEKTETSIEKKEEINLRNGYKLCLKCGAKCRKTDKFCMNCGTAVGRQGEKKNVKVAICSNLVSDE